MARIFGITILALILSGCSLIVKEPPVEISTPLDLQTKLDNKESFILVIGNELGCQSCNSYMRGGLRELEKNKDYKVDYLTVDTVEKQKDMDVLTDILFNKFEVPTDKPLGVPSTFVIKDGELVEKVEGAMVYEQLIKPYEQYIEKE